MWLMICILFDISCSALYNWSSIWKLKEEKTEDNEVNETEKGSDQKIKSYENESNLDDNNNNNTESKV